MNFNQILGKSSTIKDFSPKSFLEKQVPYFECFQEGVAFYRVYQPEDISLQDIELDFSKMDPFQYIRSRVGRRLKLIYCNQSYIESSGYSKEELFSCRDVVSKVMERTEMSQEMTLSLWQEFSQGLPWEVLSRWKRPDKHFIAFKSHSIPFSTDKEHYVFSIHSDITPLILERNQLQAELEETKKTNERLTRMTNNIAMICHDLTSPAASIKQYIWHMKRAPESKDSSIDVIEKNADYLLGLTGVTINYEQLISGQLALQPDWLPLPHFGQFLDSTVAHQVQEKGLKWKLELPPGLVELWIDPLQFARILSNLVGNAIKFTEKGHIKLSCKLTGGLAPSKGVKLRISDTGIGIALQDQENVLQPYTSLARSTTGEKGHGLGLATVRELVDLMEGSLKITSAPSKGTTITVNLPHVPYIGHHGTG